MILKKGTATHEEIAEGFKIASEISDKLKTIKNPAVLKMVKEFVSLVRIELLQEEHDKAALHHSDAPAKPSDQPTLYADLSEALTKEE